jgi:two-component system response regulator HupR/HoxA
MFGKQKKEEKRTVLFVDDDEIVLRSLERGLLDEPYNKLFATSCKEALEMLEREEVHVIVTDMLMPEMNGLEFLKVVREKYPRIVRLVLSGYMHDTELQTAINQKEIFTFIPKPWKLSGQEFEKVIRRAVDHYNLQFKHEMVGR